LLNIVDEILVNLLAVFIVFIARLFGLDVFTRTIRLSRRLPIAIRKLNGKETVVLFTDCDDELHTTRALAVGVETALKSSGIRAKVMVMHDGLDLLRCPLTTPPVIGVVLLLTDVTQLSSYPRDRAGLQDRLVKYAHRGGCLILGHDVIYRRSRNERLQKLAGCVLDNFKRMEESVKYKKVSAAPRATTDTKLLSELPDSLELTDNEIVIGNWMDDVEYLYHWQDDEAVPLVTRRTVGAGRVYWVNSGDTNISGPPRSLARPESDFVNLLATLIRHGGSYVKSTEAVT
jgi:hypothetical protein